MNRDNEQCRFSHIFSDRLSTEPSAIASKSCFDDFRNWHICVEIVMSHQLSLYFLFKNSTLIPKIPILIYCSIFEFDAGQIHKITKVIFSTDPQHSTFSMKIKSAQCMSAFGQVVM